MRKLNLLSFLLFMLLGVSAAQAEGYSYDFNDLTANTDGIEDRTWAPTGWGRKCNLNEDYTSTRTIKYYVSDGCVYCDGTRNYYEFLVGNKNLFDCIVTPAVGGTITLKGKQNPNYKNGDRIIRIYYCNKNDDGSYTFVSSTPACTFNMGLDWAEYTMTDVPEGSYLGIYLLNAAIDDFSATISATGGGGGTDPVDPTDPENPEERDPAKYFEDFESYTEWAQNLEGWTLPSLWYAVKMSSIGGYTDGEEPMVLYTYYSSSNSNKATFGTPIKFTAGEEFSFDAGAWTEDASLTFYTSTNGNIWIPKMEISTNGENAFSREVAGSTSDYKGTTNYYAPKTFKVEMPEGEYYIAFSGWNTFVDNLYGGELGEAEVVTTPDPQLSATQIAFGQVEQGTEATQTVTLSNAGDGDMTVSQIIVPDNFNVSPIAPISIPAGMSQEFIVTMLTETVGEKGGVLTFVISEVETQPTVGLSGSVIEAVEPGYVMPVLSESSLNFGPVTQDDFAPVQSVILRNEGSKAMEVTAIHMTSPFTITPSSPLTIEAGEGQTFEVSMLTETPGIFNGNIEFLVEGADAPVYLNLTGEVIEKAGGTIEPILSEASIDFGTVTEGDIDVVKDVTLHNNGTMYMDVTAIDVPTGFSINPTAPITIAGGESMTFTISMNTETVGEYNGNIVFTIDGTDALVQLTVSGTVQAKSDPSGPTTEEVIQIGTPSDNSRFAPIYYYYRNSQSVTLYTEDMLADVKGGKITQLMYKGYRKDDKSITSDVKAWIVPISNASDFNTNMEKNPGEQYVVFEGAITISGQTDATPAPMLTLPLSTPYEYDGGMIMIYIQSTNGTADSNNWFFEAETDNSYVLVRHSDNSYYNAEWKTVINYTNVLRPVVYMTVAKAGSEPEATPAPEENNDGGIITGHEEQEDNTINVSLEWKAPIGENLNVLGYNIYVNGTKVASVGPDVYTYTHNYEGPAFPIFGVTAQYASGESEMLAEHDEEITSIVTGVESISVKANSAMAVAGGVKVSSLGLNRVVVTDLAGRVYVDSRLAGSNNYSLPAGAYIVAVGKQTFKVLVK